MFHQIESLVDNTHESIEELEELLEDPEKNKEKTRELVVEDIYDQLRNRGELAKIVKVMGELAEKALTADSEDANAKKLQEILEEIEPVRGDAVKPIKKLAAKLQDHIVWEYRKSRFASNCHRLKNGNTLITGTSDAAENNHLVIEVTQDKEVVWEYSEGFKDRPCDVQRLENGNTLIADCVGDYVIGVTRDKEIVWKYGAIECPGSVKRLENGNILISVGMENRVIEVVGP